MQYIKECVQSYQNYYIDEDKNSMYPFYLYSLFVFKNESFEILRQQLGYKIYMKRDDNELICCYWKCHKKILNGDVYFGCFKNKILNKESNNTQYEAYCCWCYNNKIV